MELITKTISRLLDGAPEYHGKKFDVPGAGGEATMDMAKEQQNPHHFIVGAQGGSRLMQREIPGTAHGCIIMATWCWT